MMYGLRCCQIIAGNFLSVTHWNVCGIENGDLLVFSAEASGKDELEPFSINCIRSGKDCLFCCYQDHKRSFTFKSDMQRKPGLSYLF